jgi:hypothetical protein
MSSDGRRSAHIITTKRVFYEKIIIKENRGSDHAHHKNGDRKRCRRIGSDVQWAIHEDRREIR